MGGQSKRSKVAKSKKKSSKSGPSSSASTKAIRKAIRFPPTSKIGSEQGDLILDLVLHCHLVDAHDLLPLRGVSRPYREAVDAKLFKHVRIVEKAGDKTCVVSATGANLPGFLPTRYGALAKKGKRTTTVTRLSHTAVVDIEAVSPSELIPLKRHLTNVHTVRLLSDGAGLQTYKPCAIGTTTAMVVFPSFLPALGTAPSSRKVPDNVVKLVQHLTSSVDDPIVGDGRGPVLFKLPGRNVAKEVWVFTHFDFKISPSRLGLYEDLLFDFQEHLGEQLLDVTIRRLKSGVVDLTLVDGNENLSGIFAAYLLWSRVAPGNLHERPPTRSSTEKVLRHVLEKHGVGLPNMAKLHFMTWDEYAATLTPAEKEMETLPYEYVHQMEVIPDMLFPEECPDCGMAHGDDSPCPAAGYESEESCPNCGRRHGHTDSEDDGMFF